MSEGAPPDRVAFWDARLLAWEAARYAPRAALNPLAWTVRRRLRAARRLLQGDLARYPRILELGCGSGLLAEALRASPDRAYLGVDLSGVAVAAARRRFAGEADRLRFEQGDALALPRLEAPLIVFLGLLDWLGEGELELLFGRLEAERLLFSFTGTDGGLGGFVYGRYRRQADRSFRALSLPAARVVDLVQTGGYRIDSLVRLTPLDPGRLVLASRR